MFDFTHLSPKNKAFRKKTVDVANQAKLVALELSDAAILNARSVLYAHVNQHNRKSYVGITVQCAGDRWDRGNGYKSNRRFANAIKKWGWGAFEHHILAFIDDREILKQSEIEAIAATGGHKSKLTYNLSPGGDALAENDKPLVGTFLETGKKTIFKSGVEAARHIVLSRDAAASVARGERLSAAGWSFRFVDDESKIPPEEWGENSRLARLREARERKLKAVSYKSGEERLYDSVSKAAKAFGVNQSTISGVLSGDSRSARGWWFCFLDDDRAMPETFGSRRTREVRDTKVFAVNLKSGERREFRNATVASAELGLYSGAASGVISGSRASAGGWWFTCDERAAPPTKYKGALVAKYKSIPVIAEELKTGNIQRFDSGKSASESLKINRSSISNILRGKKQNAKGYTFRRDTKT